MDPFSVLSLQKVRCKLFIYSTSLDSCHISDEYRIGALKCNYSRITVVLSKQMTNATKHLSGNYVIKCIIACQKYFVLC